MDCIQHYPEGYIVPIFQWNPNKISIKLTLSDENLRCKAIDGSGFKSVVGDMAFLPGQRYYFELVVDKGSLIKIGVCQENINVEEAFSDTEKGWAIYNGELRHNSNSSGAKYGSSYKGGDVIGVYVDMIEGTLSFSKNKENWGVAFKEEKFKTEALYAAVAPIYKDDGCLLNMSIKED